MSAIPAGKAQAPGCGPRGPPRAFLLCTPCLWLPSCSASATPNHVHVLSPSLTGCVLCLELFSFCAPCLSILQPTDTCSPCLPNPVHLAVPPSLHPYSTLWPMCALCGPSLLSVYSELLPVPSSVQGPWRAALKCVQRLREWEMEDPFDPRTVSPVSFCLISPEGGGRITGENNQGKCLHI